jgi:quinohemoprotein amine dehydrogenase
MEIPVKKKKFMRSIQICCLTRGRIFVLESGHPGMRPGVKVVLVDRILSPPSIRGNIVMLRKSSRAGLAVFLGAAWFPAAALSQAPAEPAAPAPEDGIPVVNRLVIDRCSACHKQDDKGNLTRISWERTTPEGWDQAVKRMVRLHGLQLSAQEARAIIRYLATYHGLAPEEAKPVMYQAERRMQDEKAPSDGVRDACMSCHTLGRVMSWRRSKEEWGLLVNMHLGYFPVSETTSFRRPPPPPDAPPPPPGADTRDPVDQALEWVAKNFPLHTPEWAAWRAEMRAPKLAGRWLLAGRQIGRDRLFGEMVIEPAGNADEFKTDTTLFCVKDGSASTRSGHAIIYAGYAWRGRSRSKDAAAEPWREVMMVSRDQSQIEGRWFWGAYDEFGIDVTLRRVGSDPVVAGVDRLALKTGAAGERLTIFGANFPEDLTAADVDLGAGVTVRRIVARTPGRITVEADVDKDAVLGKRGAAVRHAAAAGAFAVYDRVDYIKVNPGDAVARLGGGGHPKGFQQFEAIGYNRGPDNKPGTADDVNLGPLDVSWSVEEFYSVYGDDDKDFVGALSPAGLFTPALEGPNPKRRFGRNNYGDVWIVAAYQPKDAASDARPLTARAYLVVTVPLYVRWDQPEVAE